MVIDNIHQLESLSGKTLFVYPVLQDSRRHRVVSEVVALVMVDVNTHKTYSISRTHPDGVFKVNNFNFLYKCNVYSYDTILLKYAGYDTSNFVDAQLQYYLKLNQPCNFETPGILNHYARYISDCSVLGSLVSLPKHEHIAYELFQRIYLADKQPGLDFYQNQLLSLFYNIEKNGLQINIDYFTKAFGQSFSVNNTKSYTQYNYYTTTGRPSNRFGGINFAALNKDDGSRDCFVSRFDDGCLVELDFNSYHPRLIASLMGYDFGKEDVYEHLAKHYHNTPAPTKTQIIQAKESTFRQIYGGISKQYLHVPFFKAAKDLAEQLWSYATQYGYVESPISGRKLMIANYQDISLYTLFNYFLQMYETEFNVITLQPILDCLQTKKAVPILYTYDSILFDVPSNELDYLLQEVIPQNIDLDKFPVKLKKGSNYSEMKLC